MSTAETLLEAGLVSASAISAAVALYLTYLVRRMPSPHAEPKSTAETPAAETEEPEYEEAEDDEEETERQAKREEDLVITRVPSKAEILAERQAITEAIERERGTRVITLIHRKEPWTAEDEEPEIVLEDSEVVLSQIRETPPDMPIDMIIHTPGGVALAAEMMAMALKFHRGKVTVIVPFYAMSGGSLVALSADEIRMEKYSILGPVDPQVEGMPAAALMAIVKKKPLESVDDRTIVWADVAAMQTQNAKDFVRWLLRDRMGEENAEKVAEFLAGGYMAHETPITLDVARGVLGLNALEGVPPLVYKLFQTYEFGQIKRPTLGFQ